MVERSRDRVAFSNVSIAAKRCSGFVDRTFLPKFHSIFHNNRHDAEIENYWRDINLTTFKSEFGDIRTMANHFGLIPLSEMRGVRIPFLQPSGDVSFLGMQELGLSYDSTLPTKAYVDPPLWPYTLEYATYQDCQIEPCPSSSFPGVWEVPMVMWFDEKNIGCSMVDSCVNM